MDINNIENKLSSLGQRHEEQVDTGALWSGVSRELDRKKKRPLFIWFFAGIVGVALVGGLSAYGFVEVEDMTNVGHTLSQESNLIKDENVIKGIAGGSGSQQSLQSGTMESKSTVHEDSNPDEEIQRIEDVQNGGTAIGQVIENASRVTNRPNIASSLSILTNKDKLMSDVDDRGTLHKSHQTSGIPNDGGQSPNTSGVSEDLSKTVTQNENVAEDEMDMKARLKQLNYNLNPLALQIDLFELQKIDLLPPQKSLVQSINDPKWRIGIHGGLVLNSMNLSAVSVHGGVAESTSYLKRKSSASPLASWELDLEMGYKVASQIYLVSGLQVRNISSQSLSELVMTEEVLRDGVVVEQVIGPDGVEDVLGQGRVTIETSSTRLRISNYRELSIPLYIEYVQEGSILSPFVGAGVDYSLLLGRSGLIHLNGLEEYNISDDPSDLMSNSLGLSLGAYGGVRLRISSGTLLNCRIGIRKELFSHFNTQSTISEKYNMVRLQLGIEHQF